ncbi:MAG: DUF4055 domain-containing protein [Desulfobacterales bacterium]|nr:DUF4055 domain-containing protein [Desulfobacterales bacterium]
MEKKNDPSVSSAEHNELMSILELPHALMGGTKVMRDKGEIFLPKGSAETPEDYESRVKRTFLFAGYERTVSILSSEVFDKPVTLQDDTPDEFKELEFDIDMQGNNISRFARKVFEPALTDGSGCILVDIPKAPRDNEGKPVETNAHEDKKLNRWPYWIHRKALDILGGRVSFQNGVSRLEQIRIREVVKEPDGEFGEIETVQIRVLEPGKWTLYRKAEDDKKKEWIVHDSGESVFKDKIPIVFYFTGRKVSLFTAKPPLTGLAELNQAHWISTSDQNNILHFARVPILFGKNLQTDDKTGKVIISPHNLLHSEVSDGDLEFVEHSGSAIGEGWKDLERTEMMMEMWGLALIAQQRSGNITATERALTGAKTGSFLVDCSLELKDAINNAIKLTCEVLRVPFEGGAEVNTDFSLALSSFGTETILKAFQIKLLDRKTVIDELKRRGEVSDNVDLQDILSGLENDARSSGGFGGLGASILTGTGADV